MPNPFLNRLAQLAPLSPAATQALSEIRLQTVQIGADQDVAREGDVPATCRILVDGVVCRYKLLSEGKRQITAFGIPGDICDLHGFATGRMDHSVASLSPCTLAVLPHPALRELVDAHPDLARGLWRHSAVETAIAREWVANVGRRSALQRLAHLLCEVFTRLSSLGLSRGLSFDWPVTQSELGDATGLSAVHCNRSLRELRIRGLVTFAGSIVTIHDWDGLRETGEFDPGYLSPL